MSEAAGVEVRFLGTGDAFGSGGRLHTSTLIRWREGRILVDCGPSALAGLRAHGFDPDSLDAVVVTHLHGDHFAGIPFLLMDAHFTTGRTRPLAVAGPEGIESAVARSHDVLFPGTGPLPFRFPLAWHEWRDGERVKVGPASVTPFPVRHSKTMTCYGLRVDAGERILAFSGDTEWCDALVPLSAGADLFVCECSAFEHAPPHHLDYQTLQLRRPSLTCRRMLLTHMGDEMLARAAELGLDTTHDGLQVMV